MSRRSISNKENEDNRSECMHSRSSRSSGTSSSSKIKMAVTMAKAKAEAAQARVAHSQEEIELKVERVRIQANLDALNAEKEKMLQWQRQKHFWLVCKIWASRYAAKLTAQFPNPSKIELPSMCRSKLACLVKVEMVKMGATTLRCCDTTATTKMQPASQLPSKSSTLSETLATELQNGFFIPCSSVHSQDVLWSQPRSYCIHRRPHQISCS